MKKSLFLSLLISGGSLMAGELDMKPTHISLFENGYGFISQRGQLPADTQIRLNSLPVPVRGSFWIAAEQGVKLQRLVSGQLDYQVNTEITPFKLAAANVGARVIVTFQRGEDQPPSFAEGTILPFPKARELREGNTIDQISEPSDNALLGNILLIKLSDRTLALQASHILDIAYLDEVKLPTTTERRPGVELEIAAPAAGKLIETTCLSSGITWLPSYRMELGEDGTAVLNAKATITNNLMNMQDVALDLVLGSPNLSDLSSIDPMALRNRSSSPRLARAGMGAYQFEADGIGDGLGEGALMSAPAAPFVMAGDSAPATALSTGNVYFYPVPGFTAKAGQVITQPLFQSKLEYKNIYTWDLPDPRRMQVNNENQPPSIGEVKREVHFTNPLELPLTDAPIEFIEADRIAATNTISFTPPKTAAVVTLGEAINFTTRKGIKLVKTTHVSHPYIDENDDDDDKKKKPERVKTTYTQTYVVTLVVNNQMSKPAELHVTQDVQGKITQISDKPSIITREPNPSVLNPQQHQIEWKLTMDAKSSKTLTYSFEYQTTRIHNKNEKP